MTRKSIIAKKGIQGILYRFKAPKLIVVMPIRPPKKMAKTKQKVITGSDITVLKNFLKPIFQKHIIVRIKKAKDSKNENTMNGDLTSQGKGLKNVFTIPIGNSKNNPPIEFPTSVTSKLEPVPIWFLVNICCWDFTVFRIFSAEY
jgi:hypothetical protein